MAEPTSKQKIGRLGEDIAVKYLENKGFSIIERNYLKKCGEIDIIAKKGKNLHFIEVKSVSRENIGELADFPSPSHRRGLWEGLEGHNVDVSRETSGYRAEDNLHSYKLKRLSRTIQLYLLEKHSEGEPEWVFGAITVHMDTMRRQAHVKFIKNIVL